MNHLIILTFCILWGVGFSADEKDPTAVIQESLIGIADVVENIPELENTVFKYCVSAEYECPNINITFWYYSRSTPDDPLQLKVTEPETFNSLPKNDFPWKIIIHGYTKSKNEIPNPQLREAYFKRGEYNLISVDYEPLARDKCYIQAVHNIPLVANCTAQMIDMLMDKGFVTPSTLHVIGYSLGAQVAGTIHEHLKHEIPHRVTGLDPAAPLFDGEINHMISQKAGEFVDVIHTNALANGKVKPLGHIDFYPNGGYNQPGCVSRNNGSIRTCNHDRAPLFYAESINSDTGFWGMPCSSYIKFYSGACNTQESQLVQMGEYVPHTARGRYYLETAGKSPFALGKRTKATLITKFDF